jgi:hypothetical protein
LRHLEMVKEIFLDYDPACWFEGYARFMCDKVMPERLKYLNLNADDAAEMTDKLEALARR